MAKSDCSREELFLKMSTIQQPVASSKHKAGKEKLAKKEKREINIAQALKNIMIMYIPLEKWYMIRLGYIVKGFNHIFKNRSFDQ